MLIKTLLNNCYPIKGFVYGDQSRLANGALLIDLRSRRRSKGQCSKCRREAPGYDTLNERQFQFIPMWGYPVSIVYRRRRVACPEHGVIVEHLPWAEGKSSITEPFRLFLSHWARFLSWKEVARQFGVNWQQVFESIEHVVAYGLRHRDMDNIRAIGVDEIQYQRGHHYLTLVYQIDLGCRRLLYIGQRRTAKTLLRFFRQLGKARCAMIQAVCSDLWKPYIKVIRKKLAHAIHILDKFHIMQYLNNAVDNTRREETARMRHEGYEPILEKSRWCLLKNKVNQTPSQLAKLRELVKYNLKTMRCYLLKESFRHLWVYRTRWGAERFLKIWLHRAMRSRLPELKKVAKRLRKHQELILNYFSCRERFTNGIVEGLNLKAKLTMRKSFGFRTFKTIKVALYHQLGKLPEPELAHRFW